MEEFLDDIRLDSQVVSSIRLPVPPSLGFELTAVRPFAALIYNLMKFTYFCRNR